MEMGKIIEEEMGYKLVGFDPGFTFRNEDWSMSVHLPFEFVKILATKLIVMRVAREILDEVEKNGYLSNVIKNIEERVDAQIP